MKISLNWLSEYVDLNKLEPRHIALEFTLKTAEVEKIHKINYYIDNVVVGEVLSVCPINNHEKLKQVEVGLGSEKINIVTKASIVQIGLKIPFALPGTILANSKTVNKIKIAGLESNGMFCSNGELGLGEYTEDFIILPPEIPSGVPLKKILPSYDYLIEINNKSITHRPDLWGHYGVARELAAIFTRELIPLKQNNLDDYNDLPTFPITIDNYSLCRGYCCLLMNNTYSHKIPLTMQWKLYTIGLRSINFLVDLTNYIMHELGQPMHVFDANNLSSIKIAQLKTNKKFITLDGNYHKLLTNDLVIWNNEEAIAIAGIMGGLYSIVNPTTSQLLLESANFQPAQIRRTSMRLGLRTDASQRFEKDLPLSFMSISIARFLWLIAYANLKIQAKTKISYKGSLGQTCRTLQIPSNYISRYIGQNLSYQKISHILSALEFKCRQEGNDLVIKIPSHRSQQDIELSQDIVEEVARFYGYNNINPQLPTIKIESNYNNNEKLYAKHQIKRFLAQSLACIEVHTYSWYDDRWLAKINWKPDKLLILSNPIAPYKSHLRQNLIPNLLEVLNKNYINRNSLNLFELGHVYTLKNNNSYETIHLGVITYRLGSIYKLESLFLEFKGLAEDIMTILGCNSLELVTGIVDISPWARANAYLEIWKNGYCYGRLGFLTGPILKIFKKDVQINWLELELEKLPILPCPMLQAKLPPIFPNTWLDFTILWPITKKYLALISVLDEFKDNLIQKRYFITKYKNEILQKEAISYSFRYWIGLNNRTLTKEDIDGFKSRFFNFLLNKGLQIH